MIWAQSRRLAQLRVGAQAVVVLALLIGIWELYVDLGGADPYVLPSPHAVAKALYESRGLLWSSFLVTGREVVLGLLMAAAASLVLAILIHFSPTLRGALYPLLAASQAVPIPMIAPVLVLWLGFGIATKMAVVALVSFFPIVVTTLAGLARVDPELHKLMSSFDASRARTFCLVELPSALPGVLTGMKIAVTVAVIGAYLAELTGASAGLGYLFQQSLAQSEVSLAYAAGWVLAAFAVTMFALLTLAERQLVPWAYESGGDRP